MANLSDLVRETTEHLSTLHHKYVDSRTALSASVADISARFGQWSTNIGASQPYEVPTSLERRVRTAQKLQDLFRTRLYNLIEDLGDCSLYPTIVSLQVVEFLTQALVIVALNEATNDTIQGVPHISAASPTFGDGSKVERSSVADITELLKAAGEDINALFKLSIVARRAATRDRYARALTRVLTDQVLSEEVEAQAIGDQFPTLRFPHLQWLRVKLTEANNTRRRFLKYCEQHAEAIARSNNSADTRKANVFSEPVSNPSQNFPSPGMQPGDGIEESDSATIGDQTTASTAHSSVFDVILRTVEHSTQDDAESFISYATQSQLEAILSVPPLETISKGEEVFICPYCRSEQAMTSQIIWRRHVFADLRAYICTHESCDLRMFEDSNAWMAHELSEHFASRHCPYCELHHELKTEHDVKNHLIQFHSSRFRSEQLSQLVQASVTEPTQILASTCHFCDWTTKLRHGNTSAISDGDIFVPVPRYRRHVGSHLEQIALLTIIYSAHDLDSELDSADGHSDNHSDDGIREAKPSPSWSTVKQFNGDGGAVITIAFSPDGKLVASGFNDGGVRIIDVAAGIELRRLESHRGSIKSIAFSSDGRTIASASGFRTVQTWRVATGRELEGLRSNGMNREAAFSPDRRLVALDDDTGMICLVEVATGLEMKRLDRHKRWIRAIKFSADGRLVASGSDDKTVGVWEVATGEGRQFEGHEGFVRAVAFSPDGRLLASGSEDNTIRLWEVRDGAEVYRSERNPVKSIAFSPNGQLVALGSDDGTLQLWEIATGVIKRLEGHEGRIWAVDFSPDGRLVASGGEDGTLRLWNVKTVWSKGRFKDRLQDFFGVRK